MNSSSSNIKSKTLLLFFVPGIVNGITKSASFEPAPFKKMVSSLDMVAMPADPKSAGVNYYKKLKIPFPT